MPLNASQAQGSRGNLEEQEHNFHIDICFILGHLSNNIFIVILRPSLIFTLLLGKAPPGVLSETLSAG